MTIWIKTFSDLDLAIDNLGTTLSLACLSALHSDFDESDLSYKVDIVNLATASPAFQKMIAQDQVALIFP